MQILYFVLSSSYCALVTYGTLVKQKSTSTCRCSINIDKATQQYITN